LLKNISFLSRYVFQAHFPAFLRYLLYIINFFIELIGIKGGQMGREPKNIQKSTKNGLKTAFFNRFLAFFRNSQAQVWVFKSGLSPGKVG